MILRLSQSLLDRIELHGEQAYPQEGAGFLLGQDEVARNVVEIIPLGNAREEEARGNRYLIRAEDYLRVEREAEDRGLEVIGVFHSHPDHPDLPSEFDREWAQPGFSYIITSVAAGRAASSRAWRLQEDREAFVEEVLQTKQPDQE